MFGPEPRENFLEALLPVPAVLHDRLRPWQIIEGADKEPSVIHYTASHHGIHMLSFGSDLPRNNDLLVMRAPCRPIIPMEKFIYSEACLGSVVAVTPCRGQVRGEQAVIGLLLRYENGDRECVGQFRFDMMMAELDVRDTSWCIGRGVEDDETVVAVEVWPPRGRGVI